MNETKYYYVKYRERRESRDEWEHYSCRIIEHPFLNRDINSSYDYYRIIDFYIEITEDEFGMKVD